MCTWRGVRSIKSYNHFKFVSVLFGSFCNLELPLKTAHTEENIKCNNSFIFSIYKTLTLRSDRTRYTCLRHFTCQHAGMFRISAFPEKAFHMGLSSHNSYGSWFPTRLQTLLARFLVKWTEGEVCKVCSLTEEHRTQLINSANFN